MEFVYALLIFLAFAGGCTIGYYNQPNTYLVTELNNETKVLRMGQCVSSPLENGNQFVSCDLATRIGEYSYASEVLSFEEIK